MQSKLLHQSGDLRTYAIVFDEGEEFIALLKEFARQNQVTGAHFTAIGAFQQVTLMYFQRQSKEYRKIPVHEQVEVLSLLGNVARKGDEVVIHAHAVVGRWNGATLGGHVGDGVVWPTLEVVLEESPAYLCRTMNEGVGLALIDLGE